MPTKKSSKKPIKKRVGEKPKADGILASAARTVGEVAAKFAMMTGIEDTAPAAVPAKAKRKAVTKKSAQKTKVRRPASKSK